MRTSRSRHTLGAIATISTLAAALVSVPSTAHAASGLYMMVGLGYGKFTGDQLIMEESGAGNDLPDTNSETCCAKGGIAGQFRVGYSLFGFGAEFMLLGNGWDIGSNTGGGGIVGGALRFYPFNIMTLAGSDMSDFPIDLGLGAGFGYALVGKNFAYTGTAFDFDVVLTYKLVSFLDVGLKIDIGLPNFGDFVYTDFKNDQGRCLDDGGQQVTGGPADNYGRFKKGDHPCNGKGPSTTLVSPQLVFTFHFDVFE